MTAVSPTATIKFKTGLYRGYLAAAAMLAYFLVSRSQLHGELTVEAARTACLSDLLLLAAVAVIYKAGDYATSSRALLNKLNTGFGAVIVATVILLAVMSQALFVKTREILNFDMLTFFVRDSGDLLAVATGSFDRELAHLLLAGLAIVALSSLQISKRWLTFLQFSVLLSPIALVMATPLIQPTEAAEDLELSSFTQQHEQGILYQGAYRNLHNTQKSWNVSIEPDWQKGILSGLAYEPVGESAIKVFGKGQIAVPVYQRPQALASHSATRPPNILLIVLESVRYDALGAYASGKQDRKSNTPFMDQLAQKGWMVERAYTTIPHTSKALVGIYCGTFARMETGISEAIPGNLPLTCLPHLLKSSGYRSAHFQTAIGTFEQRMAFLSNVGFDDRFTQESFEADKRKWASLAYLGIDDRAMIDPAANWMSLQKKRGIPFFASMLTLTTHHPYVTPSNIKAVHTPDEARIAYDGAIRYTDDWMRELFGKLKGMDLLDNTLVVITGDHGEAFAEHGTIAHNSTGYEEGIRVPMILSGPMLGKHKVIRGLWQHTDIMPSLLDIAGVSYTGKLPGISMFGDSPGHSDLITSCFYRDYCLTHISSDDGKAIFFYGKRDVEMYDLAMDPRETHNLYAKATKEQAFQRLGVAYQMKLSFASVYDAAESGKGPELVRR